MDTFIELVIGNLIVLPFIIAWIKFRSITAGERINDWLQDNNFTLISKKYYLYKGAYHDGFMLADMVYKLEIKDQNENSKSCWIKLGSVYFGLLSKKLEYKWE